MANSYVFGPVPSRRLGRSLGVDPLSSKTCNWNCTYCQLGRSPGRLMFERGEYSPRVEVVRQVEDAWSEHRDEIDWVTFSGSGEPTLHQGLGWMIRRLKGLGVPKIAVITNGSLLHLEDVRDDLSSASVVMPKLDAGSDHLHRRINRAPSWLRFDEYVEGLIAFRKSYSGKLWMETMLVAGLNDSDEALHELAAIMNRIAPDEIHLNVPIRPPAEPWVRVPGPEVLQRARAILGMRARIVPSEVDQTVGLGLCGDLADSLDAVLRRHPMAHRDLARTLPRWTRSSVDDALTRLRQEGRAQVVTHGGEQFWSAAGAPLRSGS